MKVALGTLDVTDEHRKAIRKALGGKGQATRGEVKDFLLQALADDVIPNIGVSTDPTPDPGETFTSSAPVTAQADVFI